MHHVRGGKEVNMVGHDDVPAGQPAMTSMSRAPFLHENLSRFVLSKNRFSVTDARGDVIDRKADPNAFEAPEVLVHIALLPRALTSASLRSCRAQRNRGQRPRLQLLRGENRFRVTTGNFSGCDPTEAADERAN